MEPDRREYLSNLAQYLTAQLADAEARVITLAAARRDVIEKLAEELTQAQIADAIGGITRARVGQILAARKRAQKNPGP